MGRDCARLIDFAQPGQPAKGSNTTSSRDRNDWHRYVKDCLADRREMQERIRCAQAWNDWEDWEECQELLDLEYGGCFYPAEHVLEARKVRGDGFAQPGPPAKEKGTQHGTS